MAARDSYWSDVDIPMTEEQRMGAFMLAQVAAIGDDEEKFTDLRWYLADMLATLVADRFEPSFGVSVEEFFADMKQRVTRGESPAAIISAAIAEHLQISKKDLLELAPHLRKRMKRCSVAPTVASLPSPASSSGAGSHAAVGARPVGGGR